MPKTPYRKRGLLYAPVDRPAAWRDLANLALLWVSDDGLPDAPVRAALSRARHACVLGQPGPVNACSALAEAVAFRLNPPRLPGGALRVGVDVEAHQSSADNRDEIRRQAERVLSLSVAAQAVDKALRKP